jgi:hypothetical protein
LVLPIIAYTLLFNKTRDKGRIVFCRVARGWGGKGGSGEVRERGGGKGEEMTQTLYAHMNIIKK